MLEVVKPIIITEHRALHLYALNNYTDVYGINRNAGEEWLVTT